MGLVIDKFSNNEVPTGSIDGSNKDFTLAHLPDPESSLEIFINGKFQILDDDYTIDDLIITFATAPWSDSILKVNYRYIDAERLYIAISKIIGAGILAGLDTADFDSDVSGAEKPANNATKNTVTTGAGEPSGGTNGDLYFRTTSNQWWAKLAGVWTKVSDETAANVAASIAGQGNLATLDQVDTAQIVNAAIEEIKIATGAITEIKVATGAITAVKVATNAITEVKINNSAITAGKLATNAVTAGKIIAGAVTADKIEANAVVAAKIAANAVTAGKIIAGAVIADKIGANAVTADKIITNAVTTDKIIANAVTSVKINVATLSAISANIGSVTSGTITGLTIQTHAAANTGIKISATGMNLYGNGFLSFFSSAPSLVGDIGEVDGNLEISGDIVLDSSNIIIIGQGGGDVEISGGGNLNIANAVNITTSLRCDSFRLDQTPSAQVNTATHYVTMNFNGTDYKVLLKSI